MISAAPLLSSQALPLTVDNRLQVRVVNGGDDPFSGFLYYSVLQPDGTIVNTREAFTVNAFDELTTAAFPTGSGFLMSASVNAGDTNTQWGQLYASLDLFPNSLITPGDQTVICAGYVSTYTALLWPQYTESDPLNNDGGAELQAIANPAAGAELSFQLFGDWYAKLLGFKFLFTADANAANRRIIINYKPGGVTTARYRSTTDITAGQAVTCFGWLGSGIPANFTGNQFFQIPDGLASQYMQISTTTENRQAGDQFSSISYLGAPNVGVR